MSGTQKKLSNATTKIATDVSIAEILHSVTHESNALSQPAAAASSSDSQARPVNCEPEANIECLQIADTTLDCAPTHLFELLKQYNIEALSQADLLLLVVYLVALESGFFAQQPLSALSYEKLTSSSIYHSKNVLKFARLMPAYSYDEIKSCYSLPLRSNVEMTPANGKVLNSVLTGVITGDLMILTITPYPSKDCGYCTCISIPRYVPSNKVKGKPLPRLFRKLDELSKTLRNNLFLPLRNQQLILLNASLYPGVLGLPAELYDVIFQYLNFKNLKTLSLVNKQMHQHVKNRMNKIETLKKTNKINFIRSQYNLRPL